MMPLVGQMWRDKDPRMKGRTVTIIKINVDQGWVEYGVQVGERIPRKVRSNVQRFMKAFDKLA